MEPNVSSAMARVYNEMIYDSVSKCRHYFDLVHHLLSKHKQEWTQVERNDILMSLMGALNQMAIHHREMVRLFSPDNFAELQHIETKKIPRIQVVKPIEKKKRKKPQEKKPKSEDKPKKKKEEPEKKKVKFSEPQPSK